MPVRGCVLGELPSVGAVRWAIRPAAAVAPTAAPAADRVPEALRVAHYFGTKVP
jgi:hypothetical protein